MRNQVKPTKEADPPGVIDRVSTRSDSGSIPGGMAGAGIPGTPGGLVAGIQVEAYTEWRNLTGQGFL